jgi:hypothetical protein
MFVFDILRENEFCDKHSQRNCTTKENHTIVAKIVVLLKVEEMYEN